MENLSQNQNHPQWRQTKGLWKLRPPMILQLNYKTCKEKVTLEEAKGKWQHEQTYILRTSVNIL